jgi:hypothetical protein
VKVEKISKDNRGSIVLITVGKKEFLILETLNGKARGADIHKSPQTDLVLEGEILWREIPFPQPEKQTVLRKGDAHITQPFHPHMMVSRGYSVVLEWIEKPELEKVDGKFVKNFYPPYREIVEATKC